ncbi:MAG: PAS domain-containing protein [Gemmatimonadales bacterium]|nr:PAS domain-containing protein [Gemmatimonadales bacterium]
MPIGALRLDAELRVLWHSALGFSVPSTTWLGRPLPELAAEAPELAAVLEAARRALATQRRQEATARVALATGHPPVDTIFVFEPERLLADEPPGLVGVRFVASCEAEASALAEQLLRRVRTTDPPIIRVDAADRVTAFNATYAALAGRDADDLTGAQVDRWMGPQDAASWHLARRRVAEAGYALCRFDGPAGAPGRYGDGLLVPSAHPGQVVRVVQRAAESSSFATANEQFTQRLLEGVPASIYLVDYAADRLLYGSPGLEAIFGFTFEEIRANWPRIVESVHPDDRASHVAHVARLASSPSGTWLETAYRLRHKDGRWRWVLAREVALEHHADGRVGQVLGLQFDVTEQREAVERLAERERLLARFLEEVPAFAFLYDARAGRIVASNTRLREYLGWDPLAAERDGAALARDMLHPDDAAVVAQRLDAFSREGHPPPRVAAYRARHADGSWRTLAVTNSVLGGDGGGTAPLVVGFATDETDRLAAERTLREGERKWRLFAGLVADAVYELDAEADRFRWSEGTASLLGLSALPRDRPATAWWLDRVHPDDLPAASAAWEALFAGHAGDRLDLQYRMRHEDGRFLHVHDVLDVERVDGRPIRGFGVLRDVSALRTAQDELGRSEARWRDSARLAADAVIETDVRADRVAWSHGLPTLLGREPPDAGLSARSWFRTLIHPADLPAIRASFEVALAGRHTRWAGEYRLRHADGHYLLLHDETEITWEDGRPVRNFSVLRDLTERERAARQLRESEERLRAVVRNARLAVYDYDAAHDFLSYGDAHTSLLGHPVTDPSRHGRAWAAALLHPDDRDRVLASQAAALAAGATQWEGEYRLRHADGHYVTVSDQCRLVRDESGRVLRIVGTLRDITERAAADAALRESEARWRAIAQLAGDLVFEADYERDVLVWTEGRERMLGRPDVRDLPGITEAWLAAIHEEDRDRVRGELEAAIAARASTFETEYRTRHEAGHWLIAQHRARLLWRDGIARPRTIGWFHDVTAERTAEARRVDQARLEALGTLAGGIAHDFNNILGIILGRAELAAGTPDAAALTHLREIERASLRARTLVRQVLQFARREHAGGETVDLLELLQQSERFLRASLPATVRLEARAAVAPGEAFVIGDAARLQQVLINLANNAALAIAPRGKGTVRLHLARRALGATEAADLDMAPGTVVELRVEDDGIGMTEEVRRRAVEPFFTTRPVGQGTGLGLSVAMGTVRQYRGALRLASVPEQGTVATVLLPQAQAPGATSVPLAGGGLPRGRGELVLVVDDEEQMRAMVALQLQRLGYRALVARHGRDALALLEAHVDVALVLSDLTMPEMAGDELLLAVRERRPHLAVMLMTGFASPSTLDRPIAALGAAAVLAKPVALADLAAALGHHFGHDT